jgi:hypothetical protein
LKLADNELIIATGRIDAEFSLDDDLIAIFSASLRVPEHCL